MFGESQMPTVILAAAVILVIYIIRSYFTKYGNFPQLSYSVPILAGFVPGHLTQLKSWKNIHLSIRLLARQLKSDAFLFTIGPQKRLFLTSLDLMKAASFRNLSERPSFMHGDQDSYLGISLTDGAEWKRLKKLLLKGFTDLGKGHRMEEVVSDEMAELSKELRGLADGRTFHIYEYLIGATSNIMTTMVCGKRFPFGSAMSKKISDVGHSQTGIAELLSLFFGVFRNRQIRAKLAEVWELARDLVKNEMASHRETFDSNYLRDYIDLYLLQENDEESAIKMSEDDLVKLMVDVLVAGSDTTAQSVRWAVYLLHKHPEVAKRARQEIAAVIGDRPPQMSDKSQMNYMSAVINELNRFASIAPASFERIAPPSAKFGDFQVIETHEEIPIMAVHWAVHYDERYWKDEKLFKPDRWLDEEGELIRHTHYVPFGIGVRSCPGEKLAHTLLFIFITTILQQFDYTVLDDVSLQPKINIVLAVDPFRMRLTVRGGQ